MTTPGRGHKGDRPQGRGIVRQLSMEAFVSKKPRLESQAGGGGAFAPLSSSSSTSRHGPTESSSANGGSPIPSQHQSPVRSVASSPPAYPGFEIWDDIHVKLPTSSRNLHQDPATGSYRPKWELIKKILSRPITNARELEEVILRINPTYRSQWDLSGLRDFFRMHCDTRTNQHFFTSTLPAMQRLTLQTPDLFPKPIPLLPIGRDGQVTLSQRQVACLLCNAFFCTFPHRNRKSNRPGQPKGQYDDYPSIQFNGLFQTQSRRSQSSCSKSQEAKLRCLLNYFDVQARFRPKHSITIIRTALPKPPEWASSNAKFIPNLRCDAKGFIEDASHDHIQVDFANKFLGGGVLGKGCVQEEILMVLFPEMIVSRLLCERLDDNEAAIFLGIQRYNNYKGYSDEFEFTGPHRDLAPLNASKTHIHRTMVAVDAVNFLSRGCFVEEQFDVEYINRELNKAYCGFVKAIHCHPSSVSGSASSSNPTLSTGNWGCGAFGGDRELKAVIQMMAASLCGYHTVEYFTFGDAALCQALTEFHAFLLHCNATVGMVYRILAELYQLRIGVDKQTGKVHFSVLRHVSDRLSKTNTSPPSLSSSSSAL